MANSLVFSYIDAAKKSTLDKALAFIDAIKDVSIIAYDDAGIKEELGDVSAFAHSISIPENVSAFVNDAGYLDADDISAFVTTEDLDSRGFLTEHQSLDAYAKTADINIHLSNLDASVENSLDIVREDVSSYLSGIRSEVDAAVVNVEGYTDDKVLAINNDLMAIINANKTSASSDLEYAITRARGDFDSSLNAIDIAKQDKFEIGAGLALQDGVLSSTIDTTLFRIVPELPATDIEDNKIYLVSTHNSTTGDMYTEHIHTPEGWEKLGEFRVTTDLSGYYTKNEIDSTISSTRQSIEATIAENQNANNLKHVETDGQISSLQDADIAINASIEEKFNTNSNAINALRNTVTDNKAITDVNTENIAAHDASIAAIIETEANDYSTLTNLIIEANNSINTANSGISANSSAINEETLNRQSDVAEINTALEGKASVSDLEALRDIVNGIDAEGINEAIQSKASAADLEALSATVDAKANTADVEIALEGKANAADFETLTSVVQGKANSADVEIALENKASASDLEALRQTVDALDLTAIQTALDGKASTSDLEAVQTAIQGKADAADVETALESKANTADVEIALQNKANASDLEALRQTVDSIDLSDLETVQEALDSKANAADLETLTTVVQGKASASDLEALQTTVNGLDIESIQTALEGKADAADLEALQATVNGLDIESVQTALEGKADAADVETLQTTVASKADATALDLKANVTDLEALQAVVADKAEAVDLESIQLALADKPDLESIQTMIANKANASDIELINSVLVNKAEQEDLVALQTSLAGKADAADVPSAADVTYLLEADNQREIKVAELEQKVDKLWDEEEESDAYDYIYDEESWNESFTNGVLRKYYDKYPDEDLYNTTTGAAATFNDKQYSVEIYSDASAQTQTGTASYKANWVSSDVQKITGVDDDSVYFIPKDVKADGTIYELFNDNTLSSSASLYIKIVGITYPGFSQSWTGAVNAPGAKFPWICPNFDTDVNASIKFVYKESTDPMDTRAEVAYPWAYKIFGKGTGHKEWGIASVAEEFKNKGFLIPDNQNNGSADWEGNAGDNNFNIAKFKMYLIKPAAPESVKTYISKVLIKYDALIERIEALESKTDSDLP